MAASISKNYLNPLNKIEFIRAFKVKAKVVVTPDGRKFKLTYKSRPFKSMIAPQHEYVFFEAVRNDHRSAVSLPRGYIDLTIALDPTGLWFDYDNWKEAKLP